MARERGTLENFKGDGNLSLNGMRWCIHTGKVPLGQQGTKMVDADQLKAWGIWQEVKI